MTRFCKAALLIPFAALLFIACVKEEDESANSVQRRIVQAYIKSNFGDIDSTDTGMYIINTLPGTGRAAEDSTFAIVRYSIKTLSNEYLESSYDSIAKLLGTYKPYNYYGTYTWPVGVGEIPDGVSELLNSMKVGGKAIGIIPPWLLSTTSSSYYSEEDGITKVYEIELVDVVDNINEYQFEQLEQFAQTNYNGMDSTFLGFYYKQLYNSTADTIANNSSVNVRYITKLLDGKVFDTNIADTAKKYELYDASSSYTPMTITYYTDVDEMITNNSAVNGFLLAINKMKYEDKAIAFFFSNYGYQEEGSMTNGKGVPPYSPLFFEIWIEEKE